MFRIVIAVSCFASLLAHRRTVVSDISRTHADEPPHPAGFVADSAEVSSGQEGEPQAPVSDAAVPWVNHRLLIKINGDTKAIKEKLMGAGLAQNQGEDTTHEDMPENLRPAAIVAEFEDASSGEDAERSPMSKRPQRRGAPHPSVLYFTILRINKIAQEIKGNLNIPSRGEQFDPMSIPVKEAQLPRMTFFWLERIKSDTEKIKAAVGGEDQPSPGMPRVRLSDLPRVDWDTAQKIYGDMKDIKYHLGA